MNEVWFQTQSEIVAEFPPQVLWYRYNSQVIGCDRTGFFPCHGDDPRRDSAYLVPQEPELRIQVGEKGRVKQGFHILRFSIESCPR